MSTLRKRLAQLEAIEAELGKARADLSAAKKQMETQGIGLQNDAQVERTTRAAAQRGLVRYIKDLQDFASFLRERGYSELANEMKARGLDPEIGYDPDLDPVIQTDARVGRMVRMPRLEEAWE